jgi:hypothetical protein
MSEYPEHTKQSAVLEEAQAIGQFLDESGYTLAEYAKVGGWSEPRLVPVTKSITKVLAEYFNIDLDKIEDEKRRMLADIRGENK